MKTRLLLAAATAAATAGAAFIPAQAEYIAPLDKVDVPFTELLADTVVLQLSVDEKGNVTDVQIWSSSHNDAIDAAAVAAAKKCRFIPALEDGVAVASWTQIYYRLSGFKTVEYPKGTAETKPGTAAPKAGTATKDGPKNEPHK